MTFKVSPTTTIIIIITHLLLATLGQVSDVSTAASRSLRDHLLRNASSLMGVTASLDGSTLFVFLATTTFTLDLGGGGSKRTSSAKEKGALNVSQAMELGVWSSLPMFSVVEDLVIRDDPTKAISTIDFVSTKYTFFTVRKTVKERTYLLLYVQTNFLKDVASRSFTVMQLDRPFAVISRLRSSSKSSSSGGAAKDAENLPENSCYVLSMDDQGRMRIRRGIVDVSRDTVRYRLPLVSFHAQVISTDGDERPIILTVDSQTMEATLYNGARDVQPSRSDQHPQLLNLSRGPVFGFISPGKQMHLWLPSDRLVLLLGDITALYDDLAADRLKSVSLQLKKVSFDEYFRDGQSYEDPSSNPSPVETMMVKVAIVSLLGSFFVVVIGALVFGARCGGRRSSDGDGSGDEGGERGRPGKRKKAKSLEVKSAYWRPLRLIDILPFANRNSQVSVGDRYGNQLSISSSSNSTLKTHQISKTPTHSGVISSTGIASPAAPSGNTSRGKIKFSKSTLSTGSGTTAAAEKTATSSNFQSKVRIRTPLVAVRSKIKSLIKKGDQLSRLK